MSSDTRIEAEGRQKYFHDVPVKGLSKLWDNNEPIPIMHTTCCGSLILMVITHNECFVGKKMSMKFNNKKSKVDFFFQSLNPFLSGNFMGILGFSASI